MNEYLAGSTSNIEVVDVLDSTKTDGSGKTGLTYNTSGLTCYYKRSNGTASVAVTLASISTLGTYVSGGFKEIDATNQPGSYEFHPPDAAFASGAKWVTFYFVGATGLARRPLKCRLLAVNPDDSVAFGMSMVPANAKQINAVSTSSVTAVNANIGTTQPINFSGTGSTAYVKSDAEQLNAQTVTAAAGVTFPSGTLASTTNITAASGVALAANQHVIVDSGTVTTLTNLPSIPANWLTAAGIAASALNGKGDWSTYAGADTAGTTTLLARLTATILFDANGFVKADVEDWKGATAPANTGDSYSIVNSGSYGNAQLLTAVQNVQNNTFIATAIPQEYANPSSGTQAVNITFAFSDETGTAKNLDSGNPTVTLVNDAGTDRSSRLGSWTNPATGKYVIPYTATSSDPLEGLHWDITGTINSKLRRTVAFTQLVDVFTSTFTSGDRTSLNAIVNKLPTNNIADETLVLAAVGSPMQAYTQPVGFLAATFPSGTLASTTNITAATGITVATNGDKTGYSLSQAFPANFSSLVIDGSGRMNAFMVGILTTLLTETTGYLAAGFKKFFNVATPTSTMNEITLVDTATAVTNGVTVTTNNDKTGYSLTQGFPTNFASQSIDSSGRVLLQPTQTGVTIPTVTTVGSVTTVTNIVSGGAITTSGGKVSEVTLVDTVTTYTGNTPQTGDSYARLGAPAGLSVSADIATVSTQTTKLQFDGSNYVKSDPQTLANSGDFNATQKTSITTAAGSATPTVTLATSQPNYAPAKAGNQMDLVNAPNATAVIAIQNGLATAASLMTVGANVSAIETQTNKLTFDGSNNLKSLVQGYASGEDPATLVLDVAASAHNISGTIGHDINASGSSADPWSTPLPGSYGAGTAGAILGALSGFATTIWTYATRTLSAFGFNVSLSDTSISTNAATAASVLTNGTYGNQSLEVLSNEILTQVQSINTGTGTGPNAVTVTCHDQSGNPLPNVDVGAMQSGVPCGAGLTDINGQVVLNVNDGVTQFAAAAGGYEGAVVTQTITGTYSITLTLTLLVITPSTSPNITGYLTCFDNAGNVEAGVTFNLSFVSGQTLAGSSFDAGARSTVSASNGLVQFTQLQLGAKYRVRRGAGAWFAFTAIDGGSGTCQMPECTSNFIP